MSADKGGRHVVYLDWLKFLVVYGIVLYHSSLPFAWSSWLIDSRDRSVALSAFTGFTFPWGIPLLFLLSGAGAYFGLRSKSGATFAIKRLYRLGLPLLAGLLLLSPLQAYFIFGATPRSLHGLVSYYPQFLGSIRFEWTPRWLGRYAYHLWFLGYLLAISLVTLPLLERLRGVRGRRWIAKMALFSHRRGGLLAFAAPLIASQLLLRTSFPAYQDWADIAVYTLVFLAGFVMAADRDFDLAIERNAGLLLKLGIASSIAVSLLLLVSGQHLVASTVPAQLAYHTSFSLFWSLNLWAWSICVLYIGVRWLRTDNAVVRYGSESALPVYVISHPVIVIFGSFIVAFQLPLVARFAILVVVAFAVTLGIYEFGVRRWNVTRLLFGLNPVPRARRLGPHPAAGLPAA